jgi:inosine-uridine nucleoside N-ribohydrolase
MINLILDTDPGDDPDDLFVLLIILLNPGLVKLLAIITGDEVFGHSRANLISCILKSFNRVDIPVFFGRKLGHKNFLFDPEELRDRTDEAQSYTSAQLSKIINKTSGQINYLCIEGATNIASLLTDYPNLTNKLSITQMGGAINYRNPLKAEHNFRLDPASAKILLSTNGLIRLVIADTTFKPQINSISNKSDIFTKINNRSEVYFKFLKENCLRFFKERFPETVMSDVIALFSVIYPNFLKFETKMFDIDITGRLSLKEDGFIILTSAVEYNVYEFYKYLNLNLLKK